MCTRFLEKDLPPSLSVDDIRASAHSGWIPRALRSPILVLVAGDVARPISAEYRDALGREGTPTRFLYAGSEFERNRAQGWQQYGELEKGFVQIVFYSSFTVFSRDARDCVWRPRDTAPVESSLLVLPQILSESQLGWFSKLFESSILKSAEDSTWLVERDNSVDAYYEKNLHPRWLVKIQRARAREEAEQAAENSKRPRLAETGLPCPIVTKA